MKSRRVIVPASGPLRGVTRVPGDKSISHRAVIFNAVARGRAIVEGLAGAADLRSTIRAMRALGCRIEEQGTGRVAIDGLAFQLKAPHATIDCGNSGTTMRLLAGLLAGQSFEARLDGDASLRRRPMERVAQPLRAMGACIDTTNGCPPLKLRGRPLQAARQRTMVASAQVKTALLLAALQAAGRSEITEPALSRDHSERLLEAMGVAIERRGTTLALEGPFVPHAADVAVCGDPSSAAFLAVAAAIIPGSRIRVREICTNPTRMGFVTVLQRMGAELSIVEQGMVAGEPVGDLHVAARGLHGVEIGPAEIPATIDEVPVLAVAAACASGRTVVTGAAELRRKESDRIATMAGLLECLGVRVHTRADGMEIEGGSLHGGLGVETGGDHRVVMSAAVAALASRGPIEIEGADAVGVSFPGFFDALDRLRA